MTHQGKFDALTKKLIKHVLGFQEGEENFVRSELFVLSNLLYHHCLAVNSHAVRRSIDGLSLKFTIHGQENRAQKLNDLTSRFLASPLFKDHYEADIEWSLLSLMLHLSNSPTQIPVTEVELLPVMCKNSSPASSQDLAEEQIDWVAYLLKDEKKFVVGPEDPLSDWSDNDDDDEPSEQVYSDTDSNESIYDCAKEQQFIQPKSVEKNQELNLVEQTHRARSWLSGNTHIQYWRGAGYQHEALSSHLAANVANVWEEAKGEERSQHISEWAVMREIIWLMMHPVSSYIFCQTEDGDFIVKTKVTVPSLTSGAASKILEHMCTPLKQLSELNGFIQKNECPELDPPTPVTLLAYVTGLQLWRRQFQSHLSVLENIVKEQETTCTLSWLERELNPWFYTLSSIYMVYYEAFIAFPEDGSRNIALRLIGSLCKGLEGAREGSVRCVLLRLLLHTLRHYFSIMHNWLQYGTFVDLANEFIIQRNESVIVTDEAFWREAFVLNCQPGCQNLEPEDPIKTGLKILLPLTIALISIGKSQELLSSLSIKPFCDNTINRNPSSSEVESKKEKTLEELLVEHVISTIKESGNKYEGKNENEEGIITEICSTHKDESATNKKPENHSLLPQEQQHLVTNWQQKDATTHTQNILDLADPLLVTDCSDSEEEHFNYQNIDLLGSMIEKIDDVPRAVSVLSFLSSSLRPLITQKQNELNAQLTDVLIHNYRLDYHCRAVRSILLMEAGDIMHEFYSHLFTKLDYGESVDSISLTLHLEYCIARLYPDLAKLFSVTVEARCDDTEEKDVEVPEEVLPVKSKGDTTTQQQLLALGLPNISIYYQAPWPMNLLLTEDIMNKFNMLFRFSLSLKRATNGLERLKFRDMASWKALVATRNDTEEADSPLQSRLHRLQLLRLWLLCFARELHNYFANVVFLPYHQSFEHLMKTKPPFSNIITNHEKLLNRVVTLCLMGSESKVSPLQVVLNKVFWLTQQLSHLWMKDIGRVTSEELTALEAQYAQVHRYMVSLLTRLTTTRFLPHLEGMTRTLANTMPLLTSEF